MLDKFYNNIHLEEIIEYKGSYDNYTQPKQRPPQTPPKISAREVMPFVEETLDRLGMTEKKVRPAFDYFALDNNIFVDDILVDVQSDKVFRYFYKQLYGETPTGEFVVGYALGHIKPKQARIREGHLARVMRTIGHELGHLFTPDLLFLRDEEAKAYAFELAWCKAIQDHNVADFKNTIMLGNFPPICDTGKVVRSLVEEGRDPLELYWDLVNRKSHYTLLPAPATIP